MKNALKLHNTIIYLLSICFKKTCKLQNKKFKIAFEKIIIPKEYYNVPIPNYLLITYLNSIIDINKLQN